MAATAAARHAWLDRLIASPGDEVRALVEGGAEVHPFGRAEPSDAAATMLFDLPKDDLAVEAFDRGALDVLEFYRKQSPRLRGLAWERNALAASDLIRVVQRLRPARTLTDLHRRFTHWNNWAENLVLDEGLDLRREYWRTLALSQDIASEAGLQPRRLLPFWLNICGDAGSHGRYDESYLAVGLLGLRRLPLSDDENANEEAALFGLARWAAAQHPTKRRFLREWRVLEGAFPRAPDYWTPLVAKVIRAVEDELFHKTRRSGITFAAAQWWREDIDMGEPRRSAPGGEAEPPPFEQHEFVLKAIRTAKPFRTLQSPIAALMAQHERYASRTGDTYYLVRTACNIGRKLLTEAGDEPRKRAETARDLGRLVLRFEAFDVFAWSLWRDALAAVGHLEAAELVGWEAVRRFPEDPQWRNQLALFLSEQRTEERAAEALLRETMALFPDNVVCRTQLAVIVGREKGGLPEALGIVHDALTIERENQVALNLARRFREGRTTKPLGTKPTPSAEAESASVEVPDDIAATARARRALFRSRQGDLAAVEEVRGIFEKDENFAYARYVAAAAGVIKAAVDDAILPTAFLAAAKAHSLDGLSVLQERAFGSDAVVVSLAGAALGDRKAEALIQAWLKEPVNDNDSRAAGLHAIAARPPSSLQTAFLADLLAASLGTAVAA